jgi:SAM-dependent methyltransferase
MIEYVFLIVQLGFVIYLLYFIIGFLAGGPFVPSSKAATRAMITMAQIKPGMTVYDLGSGDGRLLFLAASRGAKAVGYELNPILAYFTKLRALFSPYRKNITVYCSNFWNADISDADILFVYLLPWHMERLAAKLKKEGKKNSRIVSNSFIFPHWKTIHRDRDNHVFVFRID